MKALIKRIGSRMESLLNRLETRENSFNLLGCAAFATIATVVWGSFAIFGGFPPIFLVGTLGLSVLFFSLSFMFAPSKKEYAKILEKRSLTKSLVELSEVSKSAPYKRACSSLVEVFNDLNKVYDDGNSAVTASEMEQATSIIKWAGEAVAIFSQQQKDLADMKEYETADDQAEFENLRNALALKLSEANEVMSAYRKNISEAHKPVVEARKLQLQTALEGYPAQEAENLTYLRKAEDQMATMQRIQS